MNRNKPDIKIFVSHRIDIESEIIENNLYVPVRCGAVFDNNSNCQILGDNTGDNISEKRDIFNEFTVLYWAWKNQQADYMGLCHYRRFLSANKNNEIKAKDEHNAGCIVTDYITPQNITKYKLYEDALRKEIEGYDAVLMEPLSLKDYNLKSNYEALQNKEWHNIECIDKIIEIMKKKYPDMIDLIDTYLYDYQYTYRYNCFIMKKDIFNQFCEWIFDILSELEKFDIPYASQRLYRHCATACEHFFGIYVLYMKKNNFKINELPLLFIKHPEKNIIPTNIKNNIVLCASSSNEYVPYLSVYLQSIKEHCSDTNNYNIIIFEHNISETNKIKLKEQIRKQNISLHFVNPMSIIHKYNLKFPSNYSIECYFRLCAPKILANYNKIIFTDVDLVFLTDPEKLYRTNINKYPLAACNDFMCGIMCNYEDDMHWKKYFKDVLKLENPYKYFNTGVLLINNTEFNKKDYTTQLLELANKKQFRILEQDTLNSFFQTNIKYLDTTWNVAIINKLWKQLILFMPQKFYEQYKKDIKKPNIIHWAGIFKPWLYPDEEYAYIWWEYARKTPYYEEILQRLVMNNNINNDNLRKVQYISNHLFYFYLKKLVYKIKTHFPSKKKKYKQKYMILKQLLKEAKTLRKKLRKI